ncbi:MULTISPECIES: hypothetical protein [unclassified Marinimicrobium]|uniref:hypothetical protein n=1 Tax=Marinimicrobium TaxID=359337 RepID=UPI00257B4026|nr:MULTISPECIES: hypothetical protein [unclassified Marinimicrobium]
MKTYEISFSDRETLPTHLESVAASLELSPEELIKRFIVEGMRPYNSNFCPSIPGTSLEDFFVQNGVLKPKG